MSIDASGDVAIQGVSLRSLPKVSLHDHLDGAVRPATISELAELIIREYRATEENYFTKSAAYFGFVNASLSLLIAAKLFEPELAPTGPLTAVKEDITKAAEKMFGPQPPSPFKWGYPDGDQRLWGLYLTFVSHHLRRDDHLSSLDGR